jgi:hypothetical protein
MNEHFLALANEYLKQAHIGPQTLAELLEQVYKSGVLDERYGAWESANAKVKETAVKLAADSITVEVVKADPYSATVNEYTPLKITK